MTILLIAATPRTNFTDEMRKVASFLPRMKENDESKALRLVKWNLKSRERRHRPVVIGA